MGDDWDDKPSAGGFGSGFGRGKSSGFGRGAVNNRLGGFGRGRSRGAAKSSGDSGFGGKSNGFSSAANGDDGWDEEPSSGFGKTNGFASGGSGSSSGGFGSSSGGFGSKSGGFGSSSGGFGGSGDAPRGGGFGGGSRSGGCYKCGEDGHLARDCPSGGGGGGGGGRSGGCYKCGEDGHMARDCPSGGGGGGGGGGNRSCYKCGEEGHISRDCPSQGASGGGGGRSCYKCGEEGHISKDCPSGGGGGGGGGGRACYKCNEEGHMARDCPSGGGGDGDRKKGCFNCGDEDHMARDCPNPKEEKEGQPPRSTYVPPEPPQEEEDIFKTVQMGINFNKYDSIPVECTGENAPQRQLSSFAEGNLHQKCLDNIALAKYDRPTPIQKWAIPCILAGRDLMGCAQTGSGKTAAFLLPVISNMLNAGLEGSAFSEVQEPACIVVGPTRELVIQIRNEAQKFSYNTMLNPVVVYGGTAVYNQLQILSKGAHIVVGTPGRLMDFIGKGKIGLSKLKYLILDEADRMLDMGFGPEIRRLVEMPNMPPKEERQTLLFSATFPEEIQKMAQDFLNNYLFVTVGKVGGANSDIEQRVYQVSQSDKREKLVSILNEAGQDRTLVFVETKKQADFLATYLSQSEFPSTSIHGDRQQKEREEALRDFRSGRAPILVATSVAARGLDIPDVKHVVNYDMPKEIDEYVHRIGRTGRCGNIGKATTFFDTDRDADHARSLVAKLSDAQQEVPDWLDEVAQGAFGGGGFGGSSSFGGRDTRKGKFGGGGGRGGGSSGGFDDFGGSSGGFGGGSSGGGFGSSGGGFGGAAEEEDWD